MIKMKLLTKQKQTKTLRMSLWLWGGRRGAKDSQGVWDGLVHCAIFKMDNQQGFTVQQMEFGSTLCGSLDGREVQGRMDTCICMAKSLNYSPESITKLLTRYTPIQNKKLKNIHTHVYIRVCVCTDTERIHRDFKHPEKLDTNTITNS